MPRPIPGPPDPRPQEVAVCALCEREVEELTLHHLVPRSRGGSETVPLCLPCHKTIHAFFSLETLERVYPTLDALRETEEIQRHLRWIRKQPDRRIRVFKRAPR